jgi:hypothetical protein
LVLLLGAASPLHHGRFGLVALGGRKADANATEGGCCASGEASAIHQPHHLTTKGNQPLSKRTSFAREAARNETKRCAARGCLLSRWRVSGYCRKHAAAGYQYGHPEGRHINPKEYAYEREEVSAFLDEHAEHPATVAAAAWLQQWLDSAWSDGRTTPAARPMQHLHSHGITGLDLLKAASAVWVYAARQPKRLPHDTRLDYALALACLRLAPREQRPAHYAGPSSILRKRTGHGYRRHTGKARREIGEQLRQKLAAFFVNLNEALNQREQERRDALAALRTPFTAALRIPTDANT